MPDNPADAVLDADTDGESNLEEYLAGTDPHNPASLLRITAIQRETNDIRVTWTTEGSHHYLLLGGTDLPGGLESHVSPLISVPPGAPSVMSYLHPAAALLPEGYYRVQIAP